MWTTEVTMIKSPEVRQRLGALRDMINTLDAAVSKKRAEAATSPQDGPGRRTTSGERAAYLLTQALHEEHMKGLIHASELVVKMFKQEFDAALVAQQKESDNGHA